MTKDLQLSSLVLDLLYRSWFSYPHGENHAVPHLHWVCSREDQYLTNKLMSFNQESINLVFNQYGNITASFSVFFNAVFGVPKKLGRLWWSWRAWLSYLYVELHNERESVYNSVNIQWNIATYNYNFYIFYNIYSRIFKSVYNPRIIIIFIIIYKN